MCSEAIGSVVRASDLTTRRDYKNLALESFSNCFSAFLSERSNLVLGRKFGIIRSPVAADVFHEFVSSRSM